MKWKNLQKPIQQNSSIGSKPVQKHIIWKKTTENHKSYRDQEASLVCSAHKNGCIIYCTLIRFDTE